jgi:diacylglycerol kinase family enzyme
MRVSIVINSNAGSVNEKLIREKIETALFRCDLHYSVSESFVETGDFLRHEIENKSDNLIVCGGDGTINACLQQLMPLNEAGMLIPPVTLICSGTANDLANEVGVSRRIERAARGILEGDIKKIDIVEVVADERKAYMVTNGGIGIPAVTAELSNRVRQGLRDRLLGREEVHRWPWLGEQVRAAVRTLGSGLYSLMLVEALREWDPKDWSIELTTQKRKIVTQSPFILINNQANIGSSFTPAPYTSNSDGTVNVLVVNGERLTEKLAAILRVRQGRIEKIEGCESFEVSEIKIKSLTNRKMRFFGDGEILHRDVSEIVVRCLYQAMPLMLTKF